MKQIIVLVLSIVILFSVVGCGRGTVPPQTGDDFEVNINIDSNIEATLKVSVLSFTSEIQLIEDLGKGFNKYFPNVEVKADPISGDLYSTIMGYFNGKKMPDIFQCSNYQMLNFRAAGVALNMDPYIKAETEAGTFDEKDYVEEYWKLGQENFNGAQCLIPGSADQVVTHLNTKILKEAGIDLNPETTLIKNGWTWDDFLTVCKQLQEYNKAHGGAKPLVDGYLDWEEEPNARSLHSL